MVLQDQMRNKNHFIYITRVDMATKLVRMVTNFDGVLPINSHVPLITWQIKIIISLLLQYLWPPNLAPCNLTWGALIYRVTWPLNHVVLQNNNIFCGVTWPINTLYIHLHWPIVTKYGKVVTDHLHNPLSTSLWEVT